jgi:hypothetical protein
VSGYTTKRRKDLWPRWIFLRALGLIFFSAFYSLSRQILGLVGSKGILPANEYLTQISKALPGASRLYYAPSVLWLNSGDRALVSLTYIGMAASVLLVLNVFPRLMIAICEILFMSFIGVAQDFASYQSDGMLLEAGLISFFVAPSGLRPGLGEKDPPSALLLFLLKWEWFRIYFESGLVKLLSGDLQWRHLTAMDHYYENGPLPTWIGWYAQQRLPELAHKATAGTILVVELGLVWLAWLPRPFRLACFALTSILQIGIISTANYAFLNYLVFSLGFLFLDDQLFERFGLPTPKEPEKNPPLKSALAVAVFAMVFYPTLVTIPGLDLPDNVRAPAQWLAPFRVANSYGLFAVMTEARYEIEFQGSDDGENWKTYRFRYKPQDVSAAPGIYAPYQPRFDWNLWFASLDQWRNNPWVLSVEARLLEGSPQVLSLFADNPFPDAPPKLVRSMIYQYWFTDAKTKAETGKWWRRELIGPYAPPLQKKAAS